MPIVGMPTKKQMEDARATWRLYDNLYLLDRSAKGNLTRVWDKKMMITVFFRNGRYRWSVMDDDGELTYSCKSFANEQDAVLAFGEALGMVNYDD
jgi:hypothetical protein